MNKQEANFSIRFRHWLKANPFKISCTFEMKDTRGEPSFPFNELKENQINYSESIRKSKKGVFMRNQGGNGEPDYTYHYKQPTFVVIHFTGKGFVIIDIPIFVIERDKSKRKSLTWERAKEIAFKVEEF